MKRGYIYKITNLLNDKIYIGKSIRCDNWHIKNYFDSGIVIQLALKKYGTDNGTYLADCITTDCFLKDFNKMEAILFNGVRHDSGDPNVWAEKILNHYTQMGIDARQKTLLFSDSLNFEKADMLYQRYSGRCKVAFGIGTYLTNDTGYPPMNQVIKLTEVNRIPVCKLSCDAGKFMGKCEEYRDYLQRAIDWHVNH